MLWVGLHFPGLSLESLLATLPPASRRGPVALLAQHRITHANAEARTRGVQAGMKRATALALAPQLVLAEADAARDAAALQAVVHVALAFTPAVSVFAAAGVLLEVQASLRYFGGAESLRRRLHAALEPLGHEAVCASAPTAQGAVILSQQPPRAPATGWHCTDLPPLHRALAHAPVNLLDSAQPHLDTLTGMGLRCLGDVRRLPREGLARRFGEALLDEIDRAWGHKPDPRPALTLPAVFDSQVELFARADTTEQLLHGAEVLLARLVAWLSAQHAFVRRFRLVLKHEGRWRDGGVPAVTAVDIALAQPSRDADHLQSLLRERLAALQLPAPTLDIALHASDIARQPPPNTELFPSARSEREGLTRLIERLQARLGPEQVQRLVRVADHRPECSGRVQPFEVGVLPERPPDTLPASRASRTRARAGPRDPRDDPALPAPLKAVIEARARPVEAARTVPSARPVWLLPEPLPLAERQSRPVFDGQVLHLLCGPERIESGWWDNALAERDYFIASTRDGALVWLYRARLPLSGGEGWFLQGLYG